MRPVWITIAHNGVLLHTRDDTRLLNWEQARELHEQLGELIARHDRSGVRATGETP